MVMITDIFNNKPFQAIELTNALIQVEQRPTLLGTLGEDLFTTVRSRSRLVAVYKETRTNQLIPVSPIGAPPVQLELGGAEARYFRSRRLAKATTVYAEEMQGILQLPLFQATQGMMQELADRAAIIRDHFELTNEHQRMGAIQGQVIDADGTTVLDDWYANWGVAVPATINFYLNVATTNVRAICDALVTLIFNASNGGWVDGRTRVHALCGNDFFTMLVNHPTVMNSYQGPAAAIYRDAMPDVFDFGGITFHRYRGAPSGSFTIAANEARFFPVGGNQVFQRVLSPAEFEPWTNTPGQELYTLTIPDEKRRAFVEVELYQYPLYMCIRPEMLRRGVAS